MRYRVLALAAMIAGVGGVETDRAVAGARISDAEILAEKKR